MKKSLAIDMEFTRIYLLVNDLHEINYFNFSLFLFKGRVRFNIFAPMKWGRNVSKQDAVLAYPNLLFFFCKYCIIYCFCGRENICVSRFFNSSRIDV